MRHCKERGNFFKRSCRQSEHFTDIQYNIINVERQWRVFVDRFEIFSQISNSILGGRTRSVETTTRTTLKVKLSAIAISNAGTLEAFVTIEDENLIYRRRLTSGDMIAQTSNGTLSFA